MAAVVPLIANPGIIMSVWQGNTLVVRQGVNEERVEFRAPKLRAFQLRALQLREPQLRAPQLKAPSVGPGRRWDVYRPKGTNRFAAPAQCS